MQAIPLVIEIWLPLQRRFVKCSKLRGQPHPATDKLRITIGKIQSRPTKNKRIRMSSLAEWLIWGMSRNRLHPVNFKSSSVSRWNLLPASILALTITSKTQFTKLWTTTKPQGKCCSTRWYKKSQYASSWWEKPSCRDRENWWEPWCKVRVFLTRPNCAWLNS